MGTIGTSVTGVFSLQNAQSVPSGPSFWYTRQYSIGTFRAAPAPAWVSPKVAVFAPVPQWAALVTISGCTSVPVHPDSSTVVGHWHVLASAPPKIGARVGSTASGGGAPHA